MSEEIENIQAPQKSEIHKDTEGASPNKLYKRYTEWFKGKYGADKAPLSFKEWLKWAQQKKFFDKVNKKIEDKHDGEEEVKNEIVNLKNDVGRNVAITLALLALVFIGINLARPKAE